MKEILLSPKLPLVFAPSRQAERNGLKRFSFLSAFLHAVVLMIFLVWTGERLQYQSPVQIISVDLGQLEPLQQHPQSQAQPLTKAVPLHVPQPAPIVRTAPAQTPATMNTQTSIPATVPQSAMTAPVGTTAPATPQSTPTPMPFRQAAGTSAITPPAAAPASPVPAKQTDNAGIKAAYTQRCRSLIERFKEYPLMARKGMVEGTVVIRGTLTRDGVLRQCSITKTSRSALLDNAALRAVKSVEKFPAVPAELQGEELIFEVPVAFHLSAE